MNRREVIRILDDLMQEAYAAGTAGPDEQIDDFDAYVDRLMALADRTWVGEAKAAFDQAVTEAGSRKDFPSPDFWVARAQAAAAIASAEQVRISNLIAWKDLQASRSTSGPGGIGIDAVEEQIEEGLGL